MNYPESIQIQLSIHGFEPCDGMKPKTGIHNQLAVYFVIRKLPPELAYDPNNIHLVVMCNENDVKTKQTDYNNIWDVIVRDVMTLETEGIYLDQNTNLRGEINFAFKIIRILQFSIYGLFQERLSM